MNQQLDIWIAGARPKTLPAALAPVAAGAGLAWHHAAGLGPKHLLLSIGCLLVALWLQIGVNYANDYSDGIRGTDEQRLGPVRLTASGLASPKAVKTAALISFGFAALAGLAVVAASGHWWLLGLGALSIAAGWYYTGGSRPYGYLGLGELFVFVFFGLVATVGTTYVLTGAAPVGAWMAGTAVGALACGLLVINNLRDLETDAQVGKRTLATRLGDRATRMFFVALVVLAGLAVVGVAASTTWWALLGLGALGFLVQPIRQLLSGVSGTALVAMLPATSLAELGLALGILLGLVVG